MRLNLIEWGWFCFSDVSPMLYHCFTTVSNPDSADKWICIVTCIVRWDSRHDILWFVAAIYRSQSTSIPQNESHSFFQDTPSLGTMHQLLDLSQEPDLDQWSGLTSRHQEVELFCFARHAAVHCRVFPLSCNPQRAKRSFLGCCFRVPTLTRLTTMNEYVMMKFYQHYLAVLTD